MPLNPKARNYERKELDVNLAVVIAIASAITFAVYGAVLPIQDSFLGTLLYERGFTQYVVVFLASTVIALTVLKYIKLSREAKALRKSWIPEPVAFSDPKSQQLLNLQKNLALDPSLIAVRSSRVLAAYRNSGNRRAAAELALDDSSFYLTASESSYTLPRILVWAIPLLGFIGTVIGISQAVTGFSGFLEEAGEIDQIREGIGAVTSGLATAFDTTLLALFLSVLVMIPLVVAERFESRLLLGVDIYINDQLLPRLRDKSDVDAETINQAVNRAVKEHLPSPEALVKPAHEYAQEAANQLAAGFVSEIGKIQDVHAQLIDKISQVNQQALEDRQDFVLTFEKQQETNRELVGEISSLIREINTGYASVSQDLAAQSEQVSTQLEQAAKALENRIVALEASTAKVGEFARLQQNLEQSLRSLEQAEQLKNVMIEVRNNLSQLQPVLTKLNKPRRITLVEQDERSQNA